MFCFSTKKRKMTTGFNFSKKQKLNTKVLEQIQLQFNTTPDRIKESRRKLKKIILRSRRKEQQKIKQYYAKRLQQTAYPLNESFGFFTKQSTRINLNKTVSFPMNETFSLCSSGYNSADSIRSKISYVEYVL